MQGICRPAPNTTAIPEPKSDSSVGVCGEGVSGGDTDATDTIKQLNKADAETHTQTIDQQEHELNKPSGSLRLFRNTSALDHL